MSNRQRKLDCWFDWAWALAFLLASTVLGFVIGVTVVWLAGGRALVSV